MYIHPLTFCLLSSSPRRLPDFLPKIYPSGPRRRRRLRHQDVKRQSTLWHGTIPRRMLIRKVLSRINTASKLTGPIIDFSVAGDTASSTNFTNEQFVSQYVQVCMHPIPSHPS